MKPLVTFSLTVLLLVSAVGLTVRAGQFEDLGIPVKKAGLMGFVVGPDQSGQRDMVYLNFMQNVGRLFLLAVDPQTGKAEQYFSPQDSGGWATVLGPDGLIYVGSHPAYGQLGGAMAVWDPKQNKVVENYRHLVKNQSIAALTYEPQSGLVFGGSGNYGGGGTQPTEKEALFFAFDPRKKEKVFETALAPGSQSYAALCAARGRVFVAVGSTLYVFDPATMAAARQVALPGSQVEISLGVHGDGRLYGLCSAGVYTVNPESCEVKLIAPSPVPVSCGFALTETGLYFGSGPHLWRYSL